MAEWNLSVRLTGQGSDLSRTLRNLSRDANAASRNVAGLRRDIQQLRRDAQTPIRVRLDVDAAHLRADVRAALSAAGSGQGIGVRLDVDAAHLRADVAAALAAAGSGQNLSVRLDVDAAHLRSDVRTALATAGAGQGLAVNLRLGNAMQLRREVNDAIRWATMGQRIEIPIGLADPMQLRRDVSDAVRWASMSQTIRVRVEPDTSALRGLGGTLPGRGGGSSGGSGLDVGLGTLIPLATAAVPLVAGLTASLGPLTGTLTAAGGAATAFGIALAGQIGALGDVADAETKYEEAVRDHGKSSKEAMEAQLAYQRILAELPPESQKAAAALTNLKTTFGDWSDDMTRFTMEPVTKSFTILEQLIPRLSPEVESFSNHFDRLLNVAGGAITTPGFDRFTDRVAELTEAKVDDFTDQVVHLLRVVSQGDADAGLVGRLLGYLRENGPAAREALNAIGDAVENLVEAASIAGPSMLTLVTAAAKLVAALPPELVAIILQTAAALKLLQLSGAGFAALAGGIGAIRAQLATLAAASTAAGGGLAGLRAAFLALGTAARASVIVAGIGLAAVAIHELMSLGQEAPPDIDKLTSALGKLGQSGKATGELTRGFGKDLDDLYDKVRNITDPSTLDNVQNGLVKVFSLGLADSTPSKDAREWLDSIDEGLTNLVRGGKADLAAEAYERLKTAYRKGGGDVSEFTGQMKDYKSALADIAFEQELAAAAQGLFGKAAQDTQAKLDAQKASADGLRQSIQALNDVNRAAGSAMSAFEQSIDDATEAVKDHGSALKMRDGELDLGSEKAREAEKVLSDLAANTDAAATAAREQGKSWEYVTGIQERGREAFIDAAAAMGLTEKQAKALADSYLGIPDEKSTRVEMRTEDAIAGLDAVIAAIEKTPNKKSVTVDALTSDAVNVLEGLGYKVTQLKDGRFKVTAETGTASRNLDELKGRRDGLADKTITIDAATAAAIRDLENVKEKVAGTKGKTIEMKAPTAAARKQLELLGFKIRDTKGKNVTITVPTGTQRANVSSLASAIAGLRDKSVTITTTFYENHIVSSTGEARSRKKLRPGHMADGGVVDYYANGGFHGIRPQFFANGAENHVAQIAPAGSWRVWAEDETGGESYIPLHPSKRTRSRAILEETARRLGGDPSGIQWNADGSLSNWSYDPVSGSLYSPSDAASIGHKTRKVKTKGGKTKEIKYYDIAAVEKKLWDLGKATVAWNRNLEKVADRAGGDVAKALASMGNEGVALAAKMAKGTDKYVASMSIALRRMMQEARASLKDFTLQLEHATGNNQIFQNNLVKLAAMGYGDLASHLASKGDQASMELAADAASSRSKAARANSAVKKANAQLSAEEMGDLIQIIAAITSKTVGIHQVADKTGIGEDVIIDIANKAKSQISKSLGSKATKFLADLGKANKQQAYADGGIRAGMYATQGGIIRFAEPSTRGEAYIPLGANKRRTAMPVLADVANRFGVGLTDGRSGRVVIIREQGPLVGASHFHIGDRKSDRDLARAIEQRQAYQLRRLGRGGVGARG